MCLYCKNSNLLPSLTTHVSDFPGCTIIIKNVPCEICDQCGEKYYTDEVAQKIERIISQVKTLMQEISVVDFNKAA